MTNNTTDNITTPRGYFYKSNSVRTAIVFFLFSIYVIFSAAALFLGADVLNKLDIAMHDKNQTARNLLIQAAENYDALSGIISIIFILCGIAFSFWIYRASANTHAQNPESKIEFSPGWCIGSYFIPILGFYWPYKSMKELWLLNVSNKKRLILTWWATYLIFNFASLAVTKMQPRSDSDLISYISIDFLSIIFGIISAIIALRIISRIQHSQIKKESPPSHNK